MSSKLDEFKSKIRIKEVIQNYLSLERKGRNYWAVCPFHSDTSPSLSVSEDKNIFKCFSCGAAGDAIGFVIKKEHLSFIDAVKKIGLITGIDTKDLVLSSNQDRGLSTKFINLYKLTELVATKYRYSLLDPLNSHVYDYLVKERGLTREDMLEYGLGYASDKDVVEELINNWNKLNPKQAISLLEAEQIGLVNKDSHGKYHDFFKNRIVFPIFSAQKKILGFSGRDMGKDSKCKYLNSLESVIFKKAQCCYNIQKVRSNEPIYIFEGFFDVISAIKGASLNGIALMGLSLSKGVVDTLYSLSKHIVMCLDNDEVGLQHTIKFGRDLLLNNFRVEVVDLISLDVKDIDELFLKDVEGAKERLGKPLCYFEWFKKFYLYKNKGVSLVHVQKIVTSLLGCIFYVENGVTKLKGGIDCERAKYIVKQTYSFYGLLDKETYKAELDQVDDQMAAYINLCVVPVEQTQSVHVKPLGVLHVPKKDDLKSQYEEQIALLVIIYGTYYDLINDIFKEVEWLIPWDEIKVFKDDVLELYEYLKGSLNLKVIEPKKLDLLKEDYLLKYSKKPVVDIRNFFQLYYQILLFLCKTSLKRLSEDLGILMADKYTSKLALEEYKLSIEEYSSKTFKKLVPFIKKR